MNFKKAIISIFLIFTILSTTTAAFAAEQQWNDIKYEVPEGYSVGTAGSNKIGMMSGKEAVVLEYFNQEKLDELNKESKLVNQTTYKIEDTEVTEYVFEKDDGKLHFLKFNKDGKDYDLTYEDLKAADEEAASEENATENNTTDANASDNNTTDANASENNTTDANATGEAKSDENQDSFNGQDKESPAYIIITSLKAKG